jgi:hypothetical protein
MCQNVKSPINGFSPFFYVRFAYDLLCPLVLLEFGVLVDVLRLVLRLGMFVGLDKGGNFSVFAVSAPGVSVGVC